MEDHSSDEYENEEEKPWVDNLHLSDPFDFLRLIDGDVSRQSESVRNRRMTGGITESI